MLSHVTRLSKYSKYQVIYYTCYIGMLYTVCRILLIYHSNNKFATIAPIPGCVIITFCPTNCDKKRRKSSLSLWIKHDIIILDNWKIWEVSYAWHIITI